MTKEEALKLIKFIAQSGLTWRKTHDKWEKWEQTGRNQKTLHEYTSEQLFDLFIQQNP